MIAVTFALPAESSAFVRRLENRRQQGALVRGDFVGSASKSEIVTLHTGVGASECRKRLGALLENDRPLVLISSGFCGGTGDRVAPGDIVIAENFSDAKLREKARAKLPKAMVGKLFSAAEVIDPAKDRYAVGRTHGAIAIDMETETISRMCEAKGIPMLGLRVVSDSPAAPFPAPPHVLFDLKMQRTKFSRLAAYLMREPFAMMRLAKFSRQITMARKNLASALSAVVPNLSP